MSRNGFLFRLVAAVVLLIVGVSVTAEAQVIRRRAADRGGVVASLAGQVVDADTGEPVFDAVISINLMAWVANKNGEFKIDILRIPDNAFNVRVQRWGYRSETYQVRLTPGVNPLNARLRSKPVATLMDLSGTSRQVDAESAKFESWFPLASPKHPDPLVFYLADGTPREVPLSDLKAIIGPGVPVASPTACIYSGGGVRVGVLLRSGELIDGIFPVCEHYLFALSARDREDGKWYYLKLNEIALIEYP